MDGVKKLTGKMRQYASTNFILAEKSDNKMSLKKTKNQVGTTTVRNRNPFLKDLTQNYNLYLMMLPAVLIIVLFNYFSMYGILIAFKKYDMLSGIMASPWVGFANFEKFFTGTYFFRLIKNTLLLGGLNWFFGFFPPIILAILMTELNSNYLKKAVQTISYLPRFIPVVVIIGMMVSILGPTGVVNNLLVENLGWRTDPILFFNEPGFFRPMYIISDIWQGAGWGSIVYMAALSGVDQQLYEAAFLDGANRFQRIWHISIPGILPTITILIILNVASIINVGYEKVFLMQNPATYDTSDVINTYIYRINFQGGVGGGNFSYSTAIGLFNSVIATLLMVIANKTVDWLNGTSLW